MPEAALFTFKNALQAHIGVLKKHESKTDEMIDILDHCHQYTSCKVSSEE